MEIGRGRPLACFCFLLCGVEALYICLRWTAPFLAAMTGICFFLSMVLTVLTFFCQRIRHITAYCLFLSAALILGFGIAWGREACAVLPAERYAQKDTASVQIEGAVISEEFYSNYLTCVGVKIDLPQESALQAKTAKVYLNLTGSYDIRIGDRICAHAELYPLDDAPEDRLTLRRLQADGFLLIGYVSSENDCYTTERGSFVLTQWLSRLQYRLADRLSSLIDGESGALNVALLLGTRDGLSERTELNFRRAGASHILALSGQHLSLMILLLTAFLQFLHCPFRLRILLLSATAIFFLALTGFSISLIRATVMLLCLQVSKLRGIPHDSLTILSVFLAVTLSFCPVWIYDAGLWLTVLAAFVLIVVIPPLLRRTASLTEKRRCKNRWVTFLWKYFVLPMLSSVIISFFLILPMALIFGEISLLSPVSNLLLSPLCALSLMLGMICLLLSCLSSVLPVFSFAASGVAFVLHQVGTLMLQIAEALGDIRGALLSLRYDFVKPMLWILLIAWLAFLLPRWNKPKRFFYVMGTWSAAFALCFVFFSGMHASDRQVSYLSDKKNELLCFTDQKDTVLCDITDGGYTIYRRFLSEYLPDGTTEIEALVLTHYHNRHISTVYKLLGDIRVRTIYLPMTMPMTDQDKAIKDESNLRAIIALAKERGVEVRYYLPQEGIDVTENFRLERLYFGMLERSTHPTISMAWQYQKEEKTQSGQLFWLGASSWEAALSDEILSVCGKSQVQIFSRHGPIIKTDYEIPVFSVLPDYVLFSDGYTAAALVPSPTAGDALRHAECLLGNTYQEMLLP